MKKALLVLGLLALTIECSAQTVVTQRIDVTTSKAPVSHTTIVRANWFEYWSKETAPRLTRICGFVNLDPKVEAGGYFSWREKGQFFVTPSLILRQKIAGGNAAVWVEPYLGLNKKSPNIFSVPEVRVLWPLGKHIELGPAAHLWAEEGKLGTAKIGASLLLKTGDFNWYTRATPWGTDRGITLRSQVGLKVSL